MHRRIEILLALVVSFATIGGFLVLQPDAAAQEPTVTSITLAPNTTTTTEPTTTSTTADPDPVYPSVEYWDRIHQCEQPDSWTIAGTFGNGLHGGGGLGISDGAWFENGGLPYAGYPGGASPLDQMRVAGHILRRYGPGAWGCR